MNIYNNKNILDKLPVNRKNSVCNCEIMKKEQIAGDT